MKIATRRCGGVLTTLVLIIGWGCGGGPPAVDTSTREATVTGTVKVKGKLLNQGTIQFDPSNIKRQAPPHKADIGKDGSYTVKTLVGENSVTVIANEVLKYGLEAELIQYNVQDGENRFDIDLPMQK